LPSPALWSLQPEFCRLQVWTELFDWPEPDYTSTNFIYQETDATAKGNFVEPDFPSSSSAPRWQAVKQFAVGLGLVPPSWGELIDLLFFQTQGG